MTLFIRRSKVSRSGQYGLAAAALLGGILVAGPGQAVAAGAPAAGGASAVSRGSLSYVGQSTPAAAIAPSTQQAARTRGALPLASPGGRSRAVTAGAPGAANSRTSAATGLLANFDGVNAIQSQRVSGFDTEPPDEGLGASTKFVANFVNVAGAIYSPSGKLLKGPFYLNTFFHETAAAFTSDPRVFFDPQSQTWFATMLEITLDAKNDVTESHVDVAVSKTADPTGNWRIFRINTEDLNHSGCPCLPDYPILGVDASNVYVSTNEFTSNQQHFNGAQLYAISKSQLTSGAANPNVVDFQNLKIAGGPAFHVQPANTYGSAPAEFLMSSLDPNGTADHRLGVWALTNPGRVTSGGTPTLKARVINSEQYTFPPNAQTPPGRCTGSLCSKGGDPTTGVLATDFDAMQEVQYINGELVGALNTGVNIAGDSAQRSGVAWFVVHPAVSGSAVAASTHVARQGYLSQSGEYLLYPHINMSPDGGMALVFGLGGPGTFPSAAYSTAAPGGSFTSIQIASAGTGPDRAFGATKAFGGVGRWGDYSNGEIIPGTQKVWLATQYIHNRGDGNENWGDRIFEVTAP
jgi:hypothetical protein